MFTRRIGAWLAAISLLVAAPAVAQEDVASAITDTPAAGFELVVSQRVDFSGLVDEEPIVVTDSWVKSFTEGTNSISIVATLFPDRVSLGSGIAGALAQIALEDRTLSALHDNVVTGPVRGDSEPVEFAVYGEGTIAFAIGAVGPDRLTVLDEALATQLEHSTGERHPLGVDGPLPIDDDSTSSLLYVFVISGVVALLFAIFLVTARRRV